MRPVFHPKLYTTDGSALTIRAGNITVSESTFVDLKIGIWVKGDRWSPLGVYSLSRSHCRQATAYSGRVVGLPQAGAAVRPAQRAEITRNRALRDPKCGAINVCTPRLPSQRYHRSHTSLLTGPGSVDGRRSGASGRALADRPPPESPARSTSCVGCALSSPDPPALYAREALMAAGPEVRSPGVVCRAGRSQRTLAQRPIVRVAPQSGLGCR